MSTSWWVASAVGAFVLSLIAAEVSDIAPWVADRILPLAARLWTRDPEMRKVYAEEWRSAPGKLFKLSVALSFLSVGIVREIARHVGTARAKRTARRSEINYAELTVDQIARLLEERQLNVRRTDDGKGIVVTNESPTAVHDLLIDMKVEPPVIYSSTSRRARRRRWHLF